MVQFPCQLFKVFPFLFVAKGDSYAVLPSSGGSSDSVKVPLRFGWETEVYNSFYIWDIKPSSDDISRNQVVDLT